MARKNAIDNADKSDWKEVNLFYDGEKYKDPVFVSINDDTWLVKRGEPVMVPPQVYEVLMNSAKQDQKAQRLFRELQKEQVVDF